MPIPTWDSRSLSSPKAGSRATAALAAPRPPPAALAHGAGVLFVPVGLDGPERLCLFAPANGHPRRWHPVIRAAFLSPWSVPAFAGPPQTRRVAQADWTDQALEEAPLRCRPTRHRALLSAIHLPQRALVEAAIALVAEGHQAPRMKDVAARAGIVPSAADRDCASIDDLLRTAFLERYETLAGAIDAIPGEGPKAIDALVALVCVRHDRAPAETAFLPRAQHGALAAVSPAQNPVAAVGRRLARGQAAGWGRPAPDSVLLVLVVGPLVQAATFAHYRALPVLSILPSRWLRGSDAPLPLRERAKDAAARIWLRRSRRPR